MSHTVLPTPKDFFVEYPLYKSIGISEVSPSEIANIIFYEDAIDCICPFCNEKNESIFNSNAKKPVKVQHMSESDQFKLMLTNVSSSPFKGVGTKQIHDYKNDYFEVQFRCARNGNHIISFNLMIFDNNLLKIGQFPSVNHIRNSNFERFELIIGKDKVNELKKGEMCHGMNLGAGALSYVRKVFEHIIEMQHNEAKSNKKWTAAKEKKYSTKRFVQKVEMLEQWLPQFIVDNKKTYYAVLSDGIHNLPDKDCMKNYQVLSECLIYILEDLNAKKNKDEQENKMKASLDQMHQKKNT